MEKIKKVLAELVLKMVQHDVKNDVNSSASGWMFQPKVPESAYRFKKSK